jgi:transposase
MHDADTIESLRLKYVELLDDLDERGRRRWAAVEARALGWGGIAAVALATGLSDRTIRTALQELDDPDPLPSHRQRRSGGGRKPHATTQPGLEDALDQLIDPTSRGSPTSPLRWTIKSTRRLADALQKQGYEVSATSVRRMLAGLGYSLQSNRKTREGRRHPGWAVSPHRRAGEGPQATGRAGDLDRYQEERSTGKPEESGADVSAAGGTAGGANARFSGPQTNEALPQTDEM